MKNSYSCRKTFTCVDFSTFLSPGVAFSLSPEVTFLVARPHFFLQAHARALLSPEVTFYSCHPSFRFLWRCGAFTFCSGFVLLVFPYLAVCAVSHRKSVCSRVGWNFVPWAMMVALAVRYPYYKHIQVIRKPLNKLFCSAFVLVLFHWRRGGVAFLPHL